MKRITRAPYGFLRLVLVLGGILAEAPHAFADSHLSDEVNPLRGTASDVDYSRGNTIPAAMRPFGFNLWTPLTDANVTNWLYRYDQSAIQGFAISHIPSPWIGDHAQLQIMPMLGPLRVEPNARAAAFTHEGELARPYSYRVDLTSSGIRAELAPSDHGAILRFTFPRSDQAYLLFDTVDAATGEVHIDQASGVISGYVEQHPPRMYFYATVDHGIGQVADPDGGGANAAIGFSTRAGEVVTLRIATSFISTAQAHDNLESEVGGKSFELLEAEAQRAWDSWLGRIEIEGATDAERVTFYSSLYRTGMYPNSMWENVAGVPQYFSPFSGSVRPGKLYINNGFWDTYRAAWPLYVLLAPTHAGEMLEGFVDAYRDVGWVTRWSSPDALDGMVGSLSDAIFGDAYLKGVTNFDAEHAYESMLKNALVYSSAAEYGRKGNRRSIFRGFIPLEDIQEAAAAWQLEDTTNDFLISRMADARGDHVHARYFRSRALTYANLFSPSVGFFRGRHADGTFRTSDADFKPNEWGYEFTEGCAWHYLTSAAHDPRGMANLHGGRDALARKLDALFAASPDYLIGSYHGVIHEMQEAFDTGMGQYAHGNEPVHSMIYMYDYAGIPSKTQRLVRDVLSNLYGPGQGDGGGYLGDEDNGQMSAWYIFGALGFYPAAPGQSQYAIGSPLFSKATLHLEKGADFVVIAHGNAPENRYIQRAQLNGVPLERAYLEHREVAAGGVLEFEMGPNPSSWASDPAASPRSLTTTDRVPQPAIDCAQGGFASSSADNPSPGETAEQAFDDDSATTWLAHEAQGHLQYQFANGENHSIDMYTVTSAADEPGRDPMDWTLSGSHDGTTWVPLDTQEAQEFKWRRQTRVFEVDSADAYEYYRLAITANHGATMTQLSEIELLADPGAESAPVERTETVTKPTLEESSAPHMTESPRTGSCSDCLNPESERRSNTAGGCELHKQGSNAWEVLTLLAWILLRRKDRADSRATN